MVGGGFAGMTAARTLCRLSNSVNVTLIESSPDYQVCPGSNQVIAGLRPALQRFEYPQSDFNGIRIIRDKVEQIDSRQRTLLLKGGTRLPYDRLILATGIDFQWNAMDGYDEQASRIVPHAWKAGSQTLLLKKQIREMRNGGLMMIVVPGNPYRCPPGPYERASLIAHYLKNFKPRSKLIILDGKTKFSKQHLFQQAWNELYPGMVEWVSSEKEGSIDRVDPASRKVHTEFSEFKADVLNIIPPQFAGHLAQSAGLVDESGWCPVNASTFESLQIAGIHVIGDACRAEPIPKSAFAASSEAKVCAAAIVEIIKGREPQAPKLINNCYSFINPDQAISITGVYGLGADRKAFGVINLAETPLDGDRRKEALHARSWHDLMLRDTFGV